MPKISVCECGHFEDDHFPDCHNCRYYYQHGDMHERKESKCKHFRKYYTAELGIIDEVTLRIEDHGLMQLMVCFDFGGTHQCYDLGILDTYRKKKGRRIGTAYGLDVILQLLRYFKVDELHKIKGRYAYALRTERETNALIHGIKRTEFDGKDVHDNKSFFSTRLIGKEWGIKDE